MQIQLVFNRQPYFDGAHKSTMADLAHWVIESGRVLTF